MPDKEIFDLNSIDTDAFAESLGLIQTPVIKFLTKEEAEEKQKEQEAIDEEPKTGEKKKKQSKLSRLREKIKQKKMEKLQKTSILLKIFRYWHKILEEGEDDAEEDVEEEGEGEEDEDDEDEEDEKPSKIKETALKRNAAPLEEEDDFLTVKRRDHEINVDESVQLKVSKNQLKKIKPEGHFAGRNKTLYDDEGSYLVLFKS